VEGSLDPSKETVWTYMQHDAFVYVGAPFLEQGPCVFR
jgi:hypothetical protein